MGLVCYLTKLSLVVVAESGAIDGTLIENFVISEIMKSYHNASAGPYMCFFDDLCMVDKFGAFNKKSDCSDLDDITRKKIRQHSTTFEFSKIKLLGILKTACDLVQITGGLYCF